jgi:DNA polymerase-3 subunit alpha (Gram-positive type)
MEKVRKGKGLEPDDEALMRENNVPEWYISSCKKIKYMFPKAHAAAYVTMAFRIAYFKVHYPIAFYITYFTVRATEFDADMMLRGKEHVVAVMKEISEKPDKTQKDKNLVTILEVVNEMYTRGYKFLPVDLYKSDAKVFLEENGDILPPLNAMAGLGENAALAIAEARKNGEFLSVEDLRLRSGINKTALEVLRLEGCLDGMEESDQMAFFSF